MLTWAICWMTQNIYKEAIRNGRAVTGGMDGFSLMLAIGGDIMLAFVVFAIVSTLVGG